jgi:hypothetical protein
VLGKLADRRRFREEALGDVDVERVRDVGVCGHGATMVNATQQGNEAGRHANTDARTTRDR